MVESVQYNRKRRCDQCQQWSLGNVHRCTHCDTVLDLVTEQKRLKQISDLRKQREAKIAELNLPPFKRRMRQFFRALEMIYMGFIAFIAWLLFWLPG